MPRPYPIPASPNHSELERNTVGWWLAAAWLMRFYPRQAESVLVTITEEAIHYAVEQTLAAFGRTVEGWDKRRKAEAEKRR